MESFEIEINNQFKGLKDPEDRTQAICSLLADSKFKLNSGTLSIAFVDDASIKDLHDSFLADPSSTDVITFPGNQTFKSVGEICISIDEAIKNSKAFGTSVSHEITLYLIHGWLHLFGLNDKNETEIKVMRLAEDEALKLVNSGITNSDYQILLNESKG